jgi:hypothetical protein
VVLTGKGQLNVDFNRKTGIQSLEKKSLKRKGEQSRRLFPACAIKSNQKQKTISPRGQQA